MTEPRYPYVRSVDHHFHIAVMRLDIRLHDCQSLKDKRGRLARTLNPIRKKYPVVISEVGNQDIWGRSGLAAVTLSSDRDLATRVLEQVASEIIQMPDVELIWHEIDLI